MNTVVGYIRSINNKYDEQTQLRLISDYCVMSDTVCNKIFRDTEPRTGRHSDERWKVEVLGDAVERSRYIYPQWEDMLVAVAEGRISTVIVDILPRLYMNKVQRDFIQTLFAKMNVKVIELAEKQIIGEATTTSQAFIYYSIRSRYKSNDLRTFPIILEIGKLYEHATENKLMVQSVYYEDTRHENGAKCRLLETKGYDVLILRKFYHLTRKTGVFFDELMAKHQEGIRVVSVDDGEFTFLDDTVRNDDLKVAIYDRYRSKAEEGSRSLQVERIRTFISLKTSWREMAYYEDFGANDSQLKALQDKLSNYDLILVDNLWKIDERLEKVLKIMAQKPIYSMKEGGLMLNGKT